MSLFPANDKERKALPIFDMISRYFPKAMREITRVCVANNVRYSPERAPTDICWNRGKSKDQFGSLFRHLLERRVDNHIFEPVSQEIAGIIGTPHVYVLAEAAWRALAALEEEIETQEQDAIKVEWVEEIAKLQPFPIPDLQQIYSKPKCPICTFSEHVMRAPAYLNGTGSATEKWLCDSGHPLVYFGDPL